MLNAFSCEVREGVTDRRRPCEGLEGAGCELALNLSNLIPLDFPVLSGPAWTVDEVLITTPVTPRNGIAVTVVRYNGRVCFNFNYAASAVTAAQTTELARRFRDALETLTGTRATEPPTAALQSIERTGTA